MAALLDGEGDLDGALGLLEELALGLGRPHQLVFERLGLLLGDEVQHLGVHLGQALRGAGRHVLERVVAAPVCVCVSVMCVRVRVRCQQRLGGELETYALWAHSWVQAESSQATEHSREAAQVASLTQASSS